MDATNIVHPVVTVITNIGLDHTEILGDTHAKIAVEKAGIIKPGIRCITATHNPDALEAIRQIASERGSPLTLVQSGDTSGRTGTADLVVWSVDEEACEFGPVSIATAENTYARLTMAMGGLYQRENAACAVAAAEAACADRGSALRPEAVRRALACTELPGRLTIRRIVGGPLLVLDGAHNALAATALASAISSLRLTHSIRETRLVIGMVGGHAPEGVLAALAPGASLVIACSPSWKRAQPAETIANAAKPHCADVRIIESVPEAVQAAIEDAGSDTLVLVTGSFYTVGEAGHKD